MLHEGVYTMTCGDQIDHDEHHSVVMAAAFWKQEHDKLKSTLDEIKELVRERRRNGEIELAEIFETILAKHEDKNESQV